MADFEFNISHGRTAEFYYRVKNNDPTNSVFTIVVLKVAEADSVLKGYDTLSALLGGSNTEANFTNYIRKSLSNTDIAAFPAPDDTANKLTLVIPTITWALAGGTLDNTIVKILMCYDPDSTGGADSALIPCCAWDYQKTTSGADLNLVFPVAGAIELS